MAAWMGGSWGRMDTCICMADSLSCSPETITTWLIAYTPIQIKSSFKEDVGCVCVCVCVCVYNGVLFSHKKEITPFAATRMDPEINILHEVRKRKTNT